VNAPRGASDCPISWRVADPALIAPRQTGNELLLSISDGIVQNGVFLTRLEQRCLRQCALHYGI